MCFELDNVTQVSNPDTLGHMYTASFELFPFHEGASYSLFMGIMNGHGPLRGHFCVVRAFLDKFAEAEDWTTVLNRAYEAKRLAADFNRHLGYTALNFQVPILTQIETVSDFACLFRCLKPHEKNLQPEEFVTIEPFLDGAFQKFDAASGGSPDKVSYELAGADCIFCLHRPQMLLNRAVRSSGSVNLAQAFSHYSWHATKKLVVCELQGVSNGSTYTFTNPTIHSLDHFFGEPDSSGRGIMEFFSAHHCNSMCCGWDTCDSKKSAHRPRSVSYDSLRTAQFQSSNTTSHDTMGISTSSLHVHDFPKMERAVPFLLNDNYLGTLL